MANLLRTLIWNEEVSLTLIDGTILAREGVRRHGLNRAACDSFSKSLLFTTFLSACLKDERGGVSLSLKGSGEVKNIAVSGNRKLEMRGAIDNSNPVYQAEENDFFGGSLSVIRDDGYTRPFVGACATVEGDLDRQFEEYFRISEQLPTFFKSRNVYSKDGEILFSGLVVLQPLPFASEESLKKAADKSYFERALDLLEAYGLEKSAKFVFSAKTDGMELRDAEYKCNCSKEYLSGVLVSLGKEELLKIIEEEGAVRIHCHYCNTDYEFSKEDVEELFPPLQKE